MYNIIVYKTEQGNAPLEKFFLEVQKQGQKPYNKLIAYIDALKLHGGDINHFFNYSMKYLDDGIYELRPGANRVLFFFFIDDEIILLDGFKKSNNKKTQKYIKQAKQMAKDYKRRNQK